MREPAHHFVYDSLTQYADLPAAMQWYRWVADVLTWIAGQYGIGGTVVANPRWPESKVFDYPDGWSEQEQRIVNAAHVVWYRSERLAHEGWGDTPHGYEWMRDAQDALTAAIDGVEHKRRDYREEFAAAHPEYVEREERKRQEAEAKRAEAEGRLF